MESRVSYMNIILFMFYVLLSSSGLVLFKLGTIDSNININIFSFHFLISIKSIIGMVCYGLSFIIWMVIVSRMNLTIAMPLSVAIVNTLVVLESCLILKEKITPLQGVGIFIVIIGVMLITFSKQ